MEVDLLGHFHILYYSANDIALKLGGIDMHLETFFINRGYQCGWQFVSLCHALHLFELNVISILERMTLSVLDSYNHGIGLWNILNDAGLCIFTVSVENTEVIAIVNKGETRGAISLRHNEPNALWSAQIIDLDHILYVSNNFRVADNRKLAVVLQG